MLYVCFSMFQDWKDIVFLTTGCTDAYKKNRMSTVVDISVLRANDIVLYVCFSVLQHVEASIPGCSCWRVSYS